MKKSLFEYAVLHHKKNEDGEITETSIVIDKKTVLAKNEQAVAFKVTREIPEDVAEDPDNVEIIIRPF